MSDKRIDDPMTRQLRRIALAIRLLGHGARKSTLCQWTGLSRRQFVTVRGRSRFKSNARRRGPPPKSFAVLFRSSRRVRQAAAFVSLCRFAGARQSTRSIENGERLCDAYEHFRELVRGSDLEFEQGVLLLDGAAAATSIEFRRCSTCPSIMLIDKMGDTQTMCHLCRHRLRRAKTD
jgi:hypothetical protein